MVERTIVAFMFWFICSFLSFCTSIALFFYVNGSNSIEMFGYSHKIAAAILGFINSGFFLINAVKSYKSCKSSWSYLYITKTGVVTTQKSSRLPVVLVTNKYPYYQIAFIKTSKEQ
ncbi:MARVEL domain-containing protein [Trichonephila inaurata madagascariensis]|uniref:MARVEL domain-containing protein n=1 Tax=Trichonephila inaurata madagascariensis TaxID=2747483 RepID=A0A8X6K2I9_9ARAC|nr:MARVEL domain-containing protein [Trichonephila inaurata madagascariensis]